MTVYFREPIKFCLLLVFALVVQPWLALAFLLFAVLVWLIGGRITARFRRESDAATRHAAERLTVIRESLMMMRLVKCYLMEQFNQSRVERQLARYSQAQMIRHRGESMARPLLILLTVLCTLLLLYVAGVIVLSGGLGVAGMVALATALVSLYRPAEKWLASRRTPETRPGVGGRSCSNSWNVAATWARWSGRSSCRRWPSGSSSTT